MPGMPAGVWGSGVEPPAKRSAIQWTMSPIEAVITAVCVIPG